MVVDGVGHSGCTLLVLYENQAKKEAPQRKPKRFSSIGPEFINPSLSPSNEIYTTLNSFYA